MKTLSFILGGKMRKPTNYKQVQELVEKMMECEHFIVFASIVFFDTKAYKGDTVTPQFVARAKKIYNAYLEDDDVTLILNEEITYLMPESWK